MTMADAVVERLIPGDLVELAGMRAVFLQRAPHPLYAGAGLLLVVWRMVEPDGSRGDWSHDALDRRQHVGQVHPSGMVDRTTRLRWALHNPAGKLPEPTGS